MCIPFHCNLKSSETLSCDDLVPIHQSNINTHRVSHGALSWFLSVGVDGPPAKSSAWVSLNSFLLFGVLLFIMHVSL